MNKEKIILWVKEKHNFLFLLIIILGFLVRLYYLEVNSAVWWDEAGYLSTAKHWFFDVPYRPNPQHAVLFPVIAGLLFKLGFSEAMVKFFVVLIPSIGSAVVMYFLGRDMYDKNIGLVGSFIMSIFWVSIFWTTRFQPDFLALFFQLLSIYFFWKWYTMNKGKYLYFSAAFLSLAFLSRTQSVLIILVYLLFLFIIEGFKFLKRKEVWISSLISIVIVVPYLISNKINYDNVLAFTSGYSSQVESKAPFGWYILKFFKIFTGADALSFLYFVLFIIGLITLINLFLGYDLLRKEESKNLRADLFNLLILVVTLAFFIFYLRIAEDRWVILVAVPMFFFIGKGIFYCLKYFSGLSKNVTFFIILFVLLLGAYSQLTLAHAMIMQKSSSYSEVKDAALWMKTNSNNTDIIVTASEPQTVYYSERKVIGWGSDEKQLEKDIDTYKPKFMVLSVFERHPDWVYKFPEVHKDNFIPIMTYKDKNDQLLLIIYELSY
ncbi:MAG TPA: glycosyltransferase family 39 protein [Candidatus Nanoarchaeia archaeon]|nr:glycosyltransferase family 39 protein [Candidatus Nanoarchaeia archaeon]